MIEVFYELRYVGSAAKYGRVCVNSNNKTVTKNGVVRERARPHDEHATYSRKRLQRRARGSCGLARAGGRASIEGRRRRERGKILKGVCGRYT